MAHIADGILFAKPLLKERIYRYIILLLNLRARFLGKGFQVAALSAEQDTGNFAVFIIAQENYRSQFISLIKPATPYPLKDTRKIFALLLNNLFISRYQLITIGCGFVQIVMNATD